MWIAVKFLLLTYAVELSAMEEFQDSSKGRSAIIIDQTSEYTQLDSKSFQQYKSNKFLTSLLRQIKTCSEMDPEMYSDALDDFMEKINQRNISILHTNSTEIHFYWSKNTTQRLSTFGGGGQVNIYTKGLIILGKKKSRYVRDTLLENSPIESNTKIPQKSHIYLGLSLYPLLTEESRIIDRYHTLPPPVYTGSPYAEGDVKRNPPLKAPTGIRLVKEAQPKLFRESHK